MRENIHIDPALKRALYEELHRAGASGGMERVQDGGRFFPDSMAAELVLEKLRTPGADPETVLRITRTAVATVFQFVRDLPVVAVTGEIRERILFEVLGGVIASQAETITAMTRQEYLNGPSGPVHLSEIS